MNLKPFHRFSLKAFALDAGKFTETDHPRDEGGKFSVGANGKSTLSEVDRKKRTPAENDAIKAYASGAMNAALRNKDSVTAYGKEMTEFAKQIDTIIYRTRLTSDTTLYRGISDKYAKELAARISKGEKTFTDLAFTATSTDPSVAGSSKFRGSKKEGGLFFKINARAGQHGCATGSGESEFLLPRQSVFTVTKFDPKTRVVECTVSSPDKPPKIGGKWWEK